MIEVFFIAFFYVLGGIATYTWFDVDAYHDTCDPDGKVPSWKVECGVALAMIICWWALIIFMLLRLFVYIFNDWRSRRGSAWRTQRK